MSKRALGRAMRWIWPASVAHQSCVSTLVSLP